MHACVVSMSPHLHACMCTFMCVDKCLYSSIHACVYVKRKEKEGRKGTRVNWLNKVNNTNKNTVNNQFNEI